MPSALNFICSMVLVFFVFSVLVSTVTEVFNTAHNRRGKCLWAGIDRLLGTEEIGLELARLLRAHPAIASLASNDADKASYLPSPVFASALVDVLIGMMKSRVTQSPYGIGEAIAALPGTERIGGVLRFLWRQANGDAAAFERNLAAYFDQLMDRVSGWYKRGAQRRCFLAGLLCAVVLNIDAVHVARALWNEPHLAEQVAGDGQRVLVSYQPNQPPGTPPDRAVSAVGHGLAAELPIGWPARWYRNIVHPTGLDLAAEMMWTAIGFLVMACACLVGAPLWFQLLGTLLPLRLAGPVPDRVTPVAPVAPAAPAYPGAPASQAPQVVANVRQGPLNFVEERIVANGKVKALQLALGVGQTGEFDVDTRGAIVREQAARGFARTGQVTTALLQGLGVDA
jgi:hypothetical protein